MKKLVPVLLAAVLLAGALYMRFGSATAPTEPRVSTPDTTPAPLAESARDDTETVGPPIDLTAPLNAETAPEATPTEDTLLTLLERAYPDEYAAFDKGLTERLEANIDQESGSLYVRTFTRDLRRNNVGYAATTPYQKLAVLFTTQHAHQVYLKEAFGPEACNAYIMTGRLDVDDRGEHTAFISETAVHLFAGLIAGRDRPVEHGDLLDTDVADWQLEITALGINDEQFNRFLDGLAEGDQDNCDISTAAIGSLLSLDPEPGARLMSLMFQDMAGG